MNLRTAIRVEKWVPRIPPFKDTQNSQNRQGSIGYLWLPISDHSNWPYLSFWGRDFSRKSHIFV